MSLMPPLLETGVNLEGCSATDTTSVVPSGRKFEFIYIISASGGLILFTRDPQTQILLVNRHQNPLRRRLLIRRRYLPLPYNIDIIHTQQFSNKGRKLHPSKHTTRTITTPTTKRLEVLRAGQLLVVEKAIGIV